MYRYTARRVGVAIAAVALVLSLSACTGGGEDKPDEAKQLNIQFVGSPVSLNPALAATGGSTVYTLLAYDPLIYQDAKGNLVPDLATSWEFTSDDNTVFEMTLRKGVKFASGKDFNADAAVASMKYFLSAGGMMLGRVGQIASIEAIDDYKVRVTYSAPFPDAALTMTQYFLIGSIIGPDGLANPESLKTTPDGAGQYIYNSEKSVVDSVYIYDRNPDYWKPDAQVFDAVTVNVIADPSAALAAIKTGQVDFVSGSSVTAAAASSAGLDVLTAGTSTWAIQILDREGELNPALADQRVRQAMMLALDRKALVEAIGSDFAAVNGQMVVKGIPGYVPKLGEEYDPVRARELLAEAGYPNGFTLHTSTSTSLDPQGTIAQAIAASLKDVGIKVELDVDTTGLPQLLARSEKKEIESMVLPVGDRNSGVAIMDTINRANLNPWAVSDKEVESLYAQSLVATQDERNGIFESMSRRWMDLAWIVPAFSPLNLFYVSPSITNVGISGANSVPVPTGPGREFAWQPAK